MSYDDLDWFTARIMLDYNNESLGADTDLPHHENLRRTEMNIMRYVMTNDGIHHLDLARKVNINRKNLTPHMKRLIMKGLVTRDNGRQGKYYPTTKRKREMSVTADIFSQVAVGMILEFYKAFLIDSPYFRSEEIDSNYPLDDGLFLFANGIGAIVTYLLTQSMNQSFDIPGRNVRSDDEKDINVNRWFKDAMSTLGVILLANFKLYMSGPLLISCNNYNKGNGAPDLQRAGMDFIKHLSSNPQHSYDEKFTTSLMTSFSRIYPSIYEQLDKIKYRLPVTEFWEINHREYEKISYWHQKKCRHKYKLPSNKSLASKYDNNLLHCCKCHKNKYITNPYRN